MQRYLIALGATLIFQPVALANELDRLYELALARDATLQAATYERAADVEARPQALAPLLPQISASASAGTIRQLARNIAMILDAAITTPWTARSHHFFAFNASVNPGSNSAPTGTVIVDPSKSAPIGSARPPRHLLDRKSSATALNAVLFSGRRKP